MISRLKQIFIYFIILLTIVTGLSAITRLTYKADLPFSYHSVNDKIYSLDDYKEIQNGDLIYSIDNFNVATQSEVEFFLNTKKAGETVTLSFAGEKSSAAISSIDLVNFYRDNFYIIITLIIGLSFWVTGVFVIAAKRKDKSAKILCLILVTFSLAILSSPGYFGIGDDWMGYAVGISYQLSYIWGSVFFLHFSFIFPVNFLKKQKIIIAIIYTAAIVLSIFVSVSVFISMRDLNIQYMKISSDLRTVVQVLFLLSIISSTLILPVKYRRHVTKKDKAQLEWIFWGTALGVSPFIIFQLIPDIFGFPYLINEEIVLMFLILIPVSFAIAVIKYRLFDIEVVIKRSIVYSVLITLIIFLYLGIIYLLNNVASPFIGPDAKIFNIIVAILIALIFSPLRVKVKNFVDSVFYREKYFFDEAISQISAGMKQCETLSILGKFLTEEINKYLPVKSIAIIVKNPDGERLRILEQNNFSEVSKDISDLRVKRLYSKFKLPFALKDKVEKDIIIDSSLELVFKKWNINIVVPLTLDSNDVTGAIVMGDKVSGLRFSASDIELLNAIASPAALAVKRLELQEKLILEELEKIKHKELSDLKSYFVAAVSHDLKTPLSSIKIFAELLRNEKISPEKSRKYLEIIEGESDRLGRMINNVLDYARIERGIKKYTMEKVNLNQTVNSVLELMKYEFIMKKFEVEKQLFKNDIYIHGDTDAINSLVENLFSNAIKYSESKKFMKVSTSASPDMTELIVEDKGKGISESNLREIFNPFFRGAHSRSSKIKGAGLGLTIVKYILDAHNGRIEVESETGKGSKFKIILPVYKNGK